MKTADQYRRERDVEKRRAERLQLELDKVTRRVLDYEQAMKAMERHNQLVIRMKQDARPEQPQYHRILGWLDAIRTFSTEVRNATTVD